MACAINLGSSVLITGGQDSGTATARVTEYNEAGYVRDLPSFRQERWLHGCSYYDNDEGTMVINIDINDFPLIYIRRSSYLVATLAVATIYPLLNCWWGLRQPGSTLESCHLLATVSMGPTSTVRS